MILVHHCCHTCKVAASTTEVAEFTYSQDGYYGRAIAMTNSDAIVGAYYHQKAYIYKNINGIWSTTSVVIDAYSSDTFFGMSVAITNNFLLVGSRSANTVNGGKVYIFNKTNETWNTATADTIIDGYTSEGGFGGAAAMTDDYAIVGASNAKKAFIFKNTSGIWDTTAVATIDGYTSEASFGTSVAINNNYAIVQNGIGK